MNFNLDSIPTKEIMPGYHAKLIHTEHMSVAFWEVEKGAVVPEHSHMNEQIMHVVKGKFEFTLNGNTNIYVANDLVVIPPYAVHSGKALTACKLMDVFSPVREAYK